MKKRVLTIIFLTCSYLIFSQNSLKSIDSLQIEYNSTKGINSKNDILYKIGIEYLSTNLDSSLQIFRRVIKNAKIINNDTLLLKGYLGMAKAFTDKTMIDSADYYFDVSEKSLEFIKNQELQKSLYNNKGILLFHKSEYNLAANEFRKALAIAEKEANLDAKSRSYNNIAICMSFMGNYKAALEMHIKSAKIAEELNDRIGLAKSYNNIGLVYKDLDELEKADEYLLKSLLIKKEEGNPIDIIGSYLNLGANQRAMGDKLKDSSMLLKAREYFQEALKLSVSSGYLRGKNNAYVNLALVESTLKNYESSIAYGQKALELAVASKDYDKEMVARTNLGDAYRYNKQFNLAKQQLLEALKMAGESQNLYVKKEVLLILSLLSKEQQNFEKALGYYEEYHKVNDSISSSEVKKNVDQLEAQYQNELKETEIQTQRAELAEKELNLARKNTQLIGLGILVSVLSLLGYLIYKQQKLKNKQLQKDSELKIALAKIETQNRLHDQRIRISRDLHDNIGAQLTFIISSIENLQYGFKIANEKLTSKLTDIGAFTKETIYELRDTIWAMNKDEITLEDLQARISNFIDKADLSSQKIKFEFNTDDAISKDFEFTSVQGMNIYRILQEAIHNAIKYAEPSLVEIDINKVEKGILFKVTDDGKGFNTQVVTQGNGLKNIKKRAEDIGAEITIESNLDMGTTILLLC
ncbi:sensor histidine kinase [Flavobacteriaceae bacterium SZ-1-7]|uniref:tetratricopeptide repeat-containing sensor histidine kinase n=1 Tax=Tamlana sedimenti TaxID=3134126 RepID=UPI003127E522